MSALDVYNLMCMQSLNSTRVQSGRGNPLNHAGVGEALRAKTAKEVNP